MENEYRTYNLQGKFVAAYGLGWNIADILRNQYHLASAQVERIDLVIGGRTVSTTTRTELKKVC